MKKKKIAILGSTGSIGQSTLEIVKKTNQFKVEILIANKNYLKIISQIKIFKPRIFINNELNELEESLNQASKINWQVPVYW